MAQQTDQMSTIGSGAPPSGNALLTKVVGTEAEAAVLYSRIYNEGLTQGHHLEEWYSNPERGTRYVTCPLCRLSCWVVRDRDRLLVRFEPGLGEPCPGPQGSSGPPGCGESSNSH